MAEQLSSFQFEDVPLDEAHRLSRWPRMNQELYHALKQKIPHSIGFSGRPVELIG
jgi:hypothetical protein